MKDSLILFFAVIFLFITLPIWLSMVIIKLCWEWAKVISNDILNME